MAVYAKAGNAVIGESILKCEATAPTERTVRTEILHGATARAKSVSEQTNWTAETR